MKLEKDRYAQMLLHAGWPIQSLHRDVMTIAGGQDGEPVAVARRIGQGHIIVIADTKFAFNTNLETATGEPLFGNRANAHFWRWLFGRFADRPDWTPPETTVDNAPPEGETPPEDKAPPEEESREAHETAKKEARS